MWQRLTLYDVRVIGHYLGVLILVSTFGLIPPLVIAALFGEWHAASRYLYAAGIFLVAGSALRFGTMTVRSFDTPHDCAGSTGFVISEDGGASLAFVTDLGRVTAEVRRAALGVRAAVLESNHDYDMLRAGPYPWPLKCRVGGDFGHLSNEAAGEFARELAEAGAKCLLLAHLSETNNTPEAARCAVAAALGSAAGEVKLSVAPAGQCGEIFEI